MTLTGKVAVEIYRPDDQAALAPVLVAFQYIHNGVTSLFQYPWDGTSNLDRRWSIELNSESTTRQKNLYA
jgi:hypothetical protein